MSTRYGNERRHIERLSLDRLREVLSYDPETGHLMWIKWLGSKCRPRRPAGGVNSSGYLKVRIDGIEYAASQLVWFHYYGIPAPAGMIIDHKNLNRTDNRIENLRLATYAQNIVNQTRTSQNTTGFKGVSRFNSSDHKGKFRSSIRVGGKRLFLGIFMTAEEAHTAYCNAAQKYHGEFARTE